jgi:hypothetical protein
MPMEARQDGSCRPLSGLHLRQANPLDIGALEAGLRTDGSLPTVLHDVCSAVDLFHSDAFPELETVASAYVVAHESRKRRDKEHHIEGDEYSPVG